MISRRTFVALGIVALPLSGCSRDEPRPVADDPIENLPPEIVAGARNYAEGIREAQRIVLEHPVPYEIEPRFFPLMT